MVLAATVIVGYCATRTAITASPITVAVLPFNNIAGDSAMDFVGDGLADEVASELARVPGVSIKSRSGALAYRGQLAPNVTEAGARLRADYLVTAVIRQERGRWVLSADFARATDATSLWDDRFVIDPNEQAAAADTLTGRLAVRLRSLFPRAVGLAAARPPNQHTPNSEAHRLYLLGLARLNGRVRGVQDAASLFRQAIGQDSLYADAYSGWAMALALMPWFHSVRPSLVHDSVKTAASRALALDSTQALPHVALGRSYWNVYDWRRAESEFETAVRLDPTNVEARVQFAWLLRNTRRYTEALAQLRVAEKEDPSSAVVLSHFAYAYARAGQIDSALAEAKRALETDSNNLSTRALSLPVYFRAGHFTEARALAARDSNRAMLARLGDPEAAREALRTLDAEPPRRGQAGRRADLYLALGDTANALSALERAAADSGLWPITLDMGDSKYDAIRHSARFRELLERVGLHDYVSTFTR